MAFMVPVTLPFTSPCTMPLTRTRPLAVLARGLPTRATLGPDVAAGNPVAHVLAGTGLALLVLGVLRDVRAGRPPPGEERALVLRRPELPELPDRDRPR